MIKMRRKIDDLSPRSFFWTSKQLFAIYFLLTTCTICPAAIPKIFAQKQGSDFCPIGFVAGDLNFCHGNSLKEQLNG